MVAQDGSLGSGTLRDALDITRTKGTLRSRTAGTDEQMITRFTRLCVESIFYPRTSTRPS